MVKFLDLTLSDMLTDAKEKYGDLDLDALSETLKSLKSNVRYNEAFNIAKLKAHIWISSAAYNGIVKNNPEFVKSHEFETKTMTRMRIKDEKIEKYTETMYRLVHDFREDFKGRDVSELMVLEKYVDIDDEDMNLDQLEKIKKYAISENLDGLKRAKASESGELALNRIAEAAAALQNHKTKIAVVTAMQANLRAENAAALVRDRAGFLNAEGRKLFGL